MIANKAAVAKALQSLEHKGVLTPRAVLEEAKNKSSVLHEHFEWDDSIAAEKHRLEQARTLIRSVKITTKTSGSPSRTIQTVRYASNPSRARGDSEYIALPSIVKDVPARTLVKQELKSMIGDLKRAIAISISKSQYLPAGVPSSLERILAQLEKVMGQL